MALIKCSSCHKDVSDKAKKCIHCGAKIQKISNNANVKNNNASANKVDAELFKNIISIVLNSILIIMVFKLGIIRTRYSGDYSIIESIIWVIRNELNIVLSADFQDLLKIVVVAYIMVCMVLCCLKNSRLNAVGKAGYIVMLIIEVLFLVIIQFVKWHINFDYLILVAYTLGLIIYFYKFNNYAIEEISIIQKKEVKESNNFNSYEEIKKLKELLDMNAINEEEFNEMKKTILEKEKEKILK